MINKNNKTGQTALILILLTAAALIFLAISLNWGRIAQTKALLTISADQSATTLASDAASYGEMQKEQYLGDTNETSGFGGYLVAIILVILAVVIAIFTFGAGSALILIVLAVIAVAAAVVNLILQVVIVQPGITSMWDKLQQDQPIQQQFYEEGITSAMEGLVTDQVNITDYFDLNTNAKFGNGNNPNGVPNDVISRFAFFYTDRLKMLNQKPLPQVSFFYSQLSEFMNGETCEQNYSDNANNPSVPINPACIALGCSADSISSACETNIPGGFQLSDACAPSSPGSSSYNPYCDPCCQPATAKDPLYSPGDPLHPTPTESLQPTSCQSDAECITNNPYGASYLDIYDPTYQNYAAGVSFLAQFGRDEQMIPAGAALPLTTLTPEGAFPNGIYPFFWLMNDYSPEVNNIDPTGTLQLSQLHWCDASVAPNYIPPTGFPTLAQLSVPGCSGKDCCVNYLEDAVPDAGTSTTVIDMVGATSATNPNPAASTDFGEGYPLTTTNNWVPADNQMCLTTWPYNGQTAKYPDGTCELSGSATASSSAIATSSTATVDALDDTMHTLSDFSAFANAILNEDVGTLSKTIQSWYPQAAQWISPKCAGNGGAGSGTDLITGAPCSFGDGPTDPNCILSDTDCNQGTTGRLLSIYNPGNYPNVTGVNNSTAPVDRLGDWNKIIISWLNQNYTNSTAWCVPDEATVLNGNTTTAEDTYINNNSSSTCSDGSTCSANGQCANGNTCVYSMCSDGNACPSSGTCSDGTMCVYPSWGSLPYVVSCLNYNAGLNSNGSAGNFGPVNNYQACAQYLSNMATAATCPTAVQGTPCDPTTLGRDLLSATAEPQPAFDGCAGKYTQWVNDSLTVFQNEAPKFALRALFLNDIYTRAMSMQRIFSQGEAALKSFLAPCGSAANCSDGGPAAQLIYGHNKGQPVHKLPNAVIYGWRDAPLSNGHPGYAHIVKITAYSPGREGTGSAHASFVLPQLPWIDTWETLIERYYALTARDGYVYVSVKRWDEDHNPVLFPNTHVLWQSVFHNPNSTVTNTGDDIFQTCTNSQLGSPVGYGLLADTVTGLQSDGLAANDQQSLINAFMLNDEGNGAIDPSAASGSYSQCLTEVNNLLAAAPSSSACAEYIASSSPQPASGGTGRSNDGDHDYSLRFVNCSSIGGYKANSPPDDLTGEGQ